PIFIGNVLMSMGQEAGKAYLQKLKGQNIAKSTASNRQILDLVIAGEFPIALHIFNHHAYISKTAGAPVEWYAIEPVTATIQTILVEGAKKEGKVSFYTGLIVDQVVRPLKEDFEKEYPFLQVDFFRGNSENIVRRVLAEYQAKRYDVDVVSGSAATSMVQRAGFMQRFYSPHLAEYPAELKDSKGFWGSTNVYFMTLGYNTRNVKASELPKTYEDLLNPRWRGQMMWSTSRGSGAPQFIGNIFTTRGQEAGKAYVQKLKQQNIAKSTASARQI